MTPAGEETTEAGAPAGAQARRFPSPAEWKPVVEQFQEPSAWRASWQLVDTLVPYAGLWCLMYVCMQVSLWLALPLAVMAGLLLVRIFIIFHDCGHGSFFRSRTANDVTGFITGLLVLTPYFHWRWEHAVHHASAGDLGRRGVGDVWTLTVREYLESSRWRRFAYRLSRNPLVLFVLAPLYLFLLRERFPTSGAAARERASVWWTDLAILVIGALMSLWFGFVPYIVLLGTVVLVAGSAGVWLFYVQHQFEDAYWERGAAWDYTAAALQGSSFYKLPGILRWISGNIGYHHIHHLSPRIPNYNLVRCHDSAPIFRDVKPLRIRTSLRSMRLHLWDEHQRKLIGFRGARQYRREG